MINKRRFSNIKKGDVIITKNRVRKPTTRHVASDAKNGAIRLYRKNQYLRGGESTTTYTYHDLYFKIIAIFSKNRTMTKIKKIHVTNFKAVEEQDFELNGAACIVTAGNNKGKSSALRGLIDRYQGAKPDVIVRQGEEKGENYMELTDGSKVGWKYTNKNETFYYITADEIKMTTGVLSAIGEKIFGSRFDIDKFVQDSTNEQNKKVQKLLGIDLSEIEKRYKSVFDERSTWNKEVKRLLALDKKKPEEISAPDIDALKDKKAEIKAENESLKSEWEKNNEAHQQEALNFNKNQNAKKKRRDDFLSDWKEIEKFEDEEANEIAKFIDLEAISRYYDKMEAPEALKEVSMLPEPKYKDLDAIDQEIEDAFKKEAEFNNYKSALKEYNAWVKEGKDARAKVDELKGSLDTINAEKLTLIKAAKLPDEFELTDDGLLYNGLPLDKNQLSTSAIYIAALKLGHLALGRLQTLHFDASFLDKNSLSEVQKWAEEKNLQLLIERADFEDGDIKYEIIEK